MSVPREEIAGRLAVVTAKTSAAAERSGRSGDDVQLVVVTKGHPESVVREAHACGVRSIGENRLDEALTKQAGLADLPDLSWHLIGPLQSRKVRRLGREFVLLHAIDRIKAARLVSEAAARGGRRQDILLEINVSGEATKTGWQVLDPPTRDAWLGEVDEIIRLPGVRMRGLMAMAPLGASEAVQHRVFGALRELSRNLRDAVSGALPELSMGMSDDFEAAIEEGATIVRIGRAILGERM